MKITAQLHSLSCMSWTHFENVHLFILLFFFVHFSQSCCSGIARTVSLIINVYLIKFKFNSTKCVCAVRVHCTSYMCKSVQKWCSRFHCVKAFIKLNGVQNVWTRTQIIFTRSLLLWISAIVIPFSSSCACNFQFLGLPSSQANICTPCKFVCENSTDRLEHHKYTE